VEEEVIAESVRKIGVPFRPDRDRGEGGGVQAVPDHWYAAMHELEADEEDLFHLAASPFHDLETATLLGDPVRVRQPVGTSAASRSQAALHRPRHGGAAARLRSYAPAPAARRRRSSGLGTSEPEPTAQPARSATARERRFRCTLQQLCKNQWRGAPREA
jgi:hypothetical protein